jgi:hypothetical protein
LGTDLVRLIAGLTQPQIEWLVAPAGERETKVLLLAGGLGLVSVHTEAGRVRVDPAP